MNGTVRFINEKNGLVAVLTEDGDYSLLEPIDTGAFELEDAVFWVAHMPLGDVVVMNVTRERLCRVLLQDHGVAKQSLAKALRLE